MNIQHMSDKRIIVVAGKGGVGKTTVTALLVDALTRAGVEVCWWLTATLP